VISLFVKNKEQRIEKDNFKIECNVANRKDCLMKANTENIKSHKELYDKMADACRNMCNRFINLL
jgi:hypothetical protein